MSKISDIYSSYKKNLDAAQAEYENSIKACFDNAYKFYNQFFRDLVINFGDRFTDKIFRSHIIDKIDCFFGKSNLNFIAVDGSCYKHNSGEFISFYGGAYGAKGVLSLSNTTKPAVQYKRWEIEKDVSVAAFVPVPYSRISEVESDTDNIFAVSESDKIELSKLHLLIMQLAEVFLAYSSVTTRVDAPNLVLIDNSLSGILGYTDFTPNKIGFIGHQLPDGKILKKVDVVIAQAHPFNTALGVPSLKISSQEFIITKFFHDNPDVTKISLQELATRTKFDSMKSLYHILNTLHDQDVIEFDNGDTIKKRVDVYDSWQQTKSCFYSICKGLFLDKQKDALKYNIVNDNGNITQRWMSPDDVQFLIAIGLRLLVEACWSKKVLLVGIVKDSASSYLTKNYLGVCRRFGKYNNKLYNKTFRSLPPTDRLFCETLPYIDKTLRQPWSTIEIDSAFMTLRIVADDNDIETLSGTYKGVTTPERLFLRSIGQFYTRHQSTKKGNTLTGHAIFVDRLAFPEWDNDSDILHITDQHLGKTDIIFYPTNASPNAGQLITYFLLDMITKNHFAQMIGYPDPLHKADRGAKSMLYNVKKLLESSEIKFRSRPITNTLREIRQEFERNVRRWHTGYIDADQQVRSN